MPRLKKRLPRLCRDRKLAISWHNGKRIYHGLWGTPEADRNYRRFLAALLENTTLPVQTGRDSPTREGSDVLVSELAISFLDSIEPQMDKSEYLLFKYAVGYLVEVYGELAVNEFSPKKLKIVRSRMIKTGTLCRGTVNKYISKIRRLFTWGVGEEIVQSTVSDSLKAVKDLRKGEEGTFDHPEREAVPQWVVEVMAYFTRCDTPLYRCDTLL